ncbi:hypothetical protein VTI28DRAFT_5461 [Corynascus sepedonium]
MSKAATCSPFHVQLTPLLACAWLPLTRRLVGQKLGCSSRSVTEEGRETQFASSFCVSKIFHCPNTFKTLPPSNPSFPHRFLSEDQVLGHTKHCFAQRCGSLTPGVFFF